MYSLPVFSKEQFGQNLPVGVDTPLGEVPTTVLLFPPNEPELTTTGLSDKTKNHFRAIRSRGRIVSKT
jgi:hypothetical protein